MLRYSVLPACATSITGLASLWPQVPFYGYTDNQVVRSSVNYESSVRALTKYFVCSDSCMLSVVYVSPSRPSRSQCAHRHQKPHHPPFLSRGNSSYLSSYSLFFPSRSLTSNHRLYHIPSPNLTSTLRPPCVFCTPNPRSQATSLSEKHFPIRTGIPTYMKRSLRPCDI